MSNELRNQDVPPIQVIDLHKSFGTLEVLKGVDFQVDTGEVVCVIGPSGSGKSTLLRCINFLEQPTSGTVLIEGIDMADPETDVDAVRTRIGMVFQQFNLFPHLTVLDNLTIGQRKVLKRSGLRAEDPAAPQCNLIKKVVPRIMTSIAPWADQSKYSNFAASFRLVASNCLLPRTGKFAPASSEFGGRIEDGAT